MLRKSVFLCIVILLLIFSFTQSEAGINLNSDGDKNAEIFSQIQLWGIASLDPANDPISDSSVDSRFDMYIRRGRIGLKGSLYDYISYTTCFAYDNLGKDRFTNTYGTAQTDDNLRFYAWDIYFTLKQSELLNLTLGYFRPQIGRESITSAFNVNSFTKALPNSYIRSHIVGRSSGRETGLNVGGNYNARNWSVNYNIGFFDTNHHAIAGGSALYNDSSSEAVSATPYYGGGLKWSPLFTTRVAFTVGEPEMDSYKLGYQINYFGKRKGITLAANATFQDEMDQFKQNNLYGMDLLLNYIYFNLDAEYDVLSRELHDGNDYEDLVYHVRFGYTIKLKSGYFFEPVFLFSGSSIAEASRLGKAEEKLYSAGFNLYLKENKWKVNLHYGVRQQEETDSEFVMLGCQFYMPFR